MIFNYLKIAFRSLRKRKGFTAINTIGLALGLATCMLIVFYVADELSYDRFYPHADRIYRINDDIKFGGNEKSYTTSPAPLSAALASELPQVEKAVRMRETGSVNVRKGSQNIQEMRTVFVDSTFFSVFQLQAVAGDIKHALGQPECMVITESRALKYFGKTDVVGQTLLLNGDRPFKVTGVVKDLPSQCHFHFDFFMSMGSLPEGKDESWLSNNFQTYLLLKEGTDVAAFEKSMAHLFKKNAGPQVQAYLHTSVEEFEQKGNYYRLNLINVQDIHLKSNRVGEFSANGNIQYVYIFSVIAAFILLIACVNFMNLSTARSANRAREVGVRKVLGSLRKQLIAQFLAESLLITFVAAILAVIIAVLLMPLFNHISGKELHFGWQAVKWLVPALVVTVVVVGCLAGSYPAFFLSAFQPVEVLKGKLSAGFKGGGLRSFLVVFQFAISVFLIIGTIVIYNQIQYIRNKDLGYNRDQLLILHHLENLGNRAEALKQEVRQIPGVRNVTVTAYLPTLKNRSSSTMFRSPAMEQDKAVHSQIWWVDEEYIDALGLQLKAGRNFSREMGTDSAGVIINESAARLMGETDPLNKVLYLPRDNMLKTVKPFHVIGVIKDFNFNSLRDNITPLALFYGADVSVLGIKVSSENVGAVLTQVKNTWKKVAPDMELAYTFMDEDFDADYRAEQRIGTIAVSFTLLAILIACLGLFGLAAYAAEQRTKEIGIRKVLGADVSAIVTMLSADFIKLVVIAIVIAAPLAWMAMRQWLQGFAYRQGIQWWVLVLAAFAAVLIAFITISFQSIKAALTNPVKSLKSE